MSSISEEKILVLDCGLFSEGTLKFLRAMLFYFGVELNLLSLTALLSMGLCDAVG